MPALAGGRPTVRSSCMRSEVDLQEEEYEQPILKITRQPFKICLPPARHTRAQNQGLPGWRCFAHRLDFESLANVVKRLQARCKEWGRAAVVTGLARDHSASVQSCIQPVRRAFQCACITLKTQSSRYPCVRLTAAQHRYHCVAQVPLRGTSS